MSQLYGQGLSGSPSPRRGGGHPIVALLAFVVVGLFLCGVAARGGINAVGALARLGTTSGTDAPNTQACQALAAPAQSYVVDKTASQGAGAATGNPKFSTSSWPGDSKTGVPAEQECVEVTANGSVVLDLFTGSPGADRNYFGSMVSADSPPHKACAHERELSMRGVARAYECDTAFDAHRLSHGRFIMFETVGGVTGAIGATSHASMPVNAAEKILSAMAGPSGTLK